MAPSEKEGVAAGVAHVTSLSDDRPGSLRAALAEPGPKTILFDVGGIISTQNTLVVPSETTIAGQTAPGDGVCLRGAWVAIQGEDVVIRFVCSRPGNAAGTDDLDDRDAFKILNARNVILDHVSAGWSVDEAVSTWFRDVQDVTIQNSIIAEALRDAGHSKGGHSMGLLIGDGARDIIGDPQSPGSQRLANPRNSKLRWCRCLSITSFTTGELARSTLPRGEHRFQKPTSANVVNNVFHSSDPEFAR